MIINKTVATICVIVFSLILSACKVEVGAPYGKVYNVTLEHFQPATALSHPLDQTMSELRCIQNGLGGVMFESMRPVRLDSMYYMEITPYPGYWNQLSLEFRQYVADLLIDCHPRDNFKLRLFCFDPDESSNGFDMTITDSYAAQRKKDPDYLLNLSLQDRLSRTAANFRSARFGTANLNGQTVEMVYRVYRDDFSRISDLVNRTEDLRTFLDGHILSDIKKYPKKLECHYYRPRKGCIKIAIPFFGPGNKCPKRPSVIKNTERPVYCMLHGGGSPHFGNALIPAF
jgi:hypothetical protein